MIRCHTFRTILLTTSLALLASNVYGQIFSSSSTVDVRNGIDWKIVGGTSFAGGTRGVGDNTRKVGASTQVDPFTSGPYSAGSIQHPLKTLTAAAGTSSTFSAVTVAPTPLSNGAYNYQMSTFAQTNAAPGGLGPFFAQAKANDPQLITTPAVYGLTYSLLSGTQLLTTASGSGTAYLDLLAINVLAEPIMSIELTSNNGGAVVPTIFFNSDPRLSFFQPGTSTPVTPGDIAAIINNPAFQADITSGDGLDVGVSFFDVFLDLSVTLPADAALGATNQSTAMAAVPEPSTFVLLGGTAIATGAVMHFRRKKLTSQFGKKWVAKCPAGRRE